MKHRLSLSMLLAKCLILQHWKSETVPMFDMWIMDMGDILHSKKIRFIKENGFVDMCKPFTTLMGKSTNGVDAS